MFQSALETRFVISVTSNVCKRVLCSAESSVQVISPLDRELHLLSLCKTRGQYDPVDVSQGLFLFRHLDSTRIFWFPLQQSCPIKEKPRVSLWQYGMLAWSSADTPEQVKASWFHFNALSFAKSCFLQSLGYSWWREAVGTVWLFCACSFHIHTVGICDIPDLDVSMDMWSYFHTCLVSIWLHRFYIYSAVAFGISLWIVVQFTTTRTKRKVTEPVSTFLWVDPKNLGGSE